MKLNMNRIGQRYGRIGITLLLSLWTISATFGSFVSGHSVENGTGGATIRYVSPTGQDATNNCTNLASPCATLQHAIDSAVSGDEIRLAQGTYSDTMEINGLDQIGYIGISLTIRGGYTSADFTQSFPLTQTTILDPQTPGRGLVITGAVTAVVENLTIKDGDATGLGGADTGDGCGDAGGGIFVHDARVTLINNVVQNNTACEGGGIFIVNSPKAALLNNEISQNVGYDYGGGFDLISSDGATILNNNIFENVADQIGPGTGQKHCGGGRIYNSSDVQFIGNAVYGNIAANSGGGLCLGVADNALVQNNLIYNNFRKAGFEGDGAGIHVQTSDFVQIVENSLYGNGSVDITNAGTLRGGGFFAKLSDNLTLRQNLIYDNAATVGGGIYLDQANSVELLANIIRNNLAVDIPTNVDGFGGGLAAVESEIVATNSVIVDNDADHAEMGSGVYLRATALSLQHPTIAGNNSLTGTAVFISDTNSTLTLTNAIVVSQAIGVDASSGGTATILDVLWYANGQNTAGTVSVAEEMTANPQFAADGFHLTFNSPAVNQATPSNVTTDVDGESRFALPDLGADEIQCYLYLPIVNKP